jgi:hypothetical protein
MFCSKALNLLRTNVLSSRSVNSVDMRFSKWTGVSISQNTITKSVILPNRIFSSSKDEDLKTRMKENATVTLLSTARESTVQLGRVIGSKVSAGDVILIFGYY